MRFLNYSLIKRKKNSFYMIHSILYGFYASNQFSIFKGKYSEIDLTLPNFLFLVWFFFGGPFKRMLHEFSVVGIIKQKF